MDQPADQGIEEHRDYSAAYPPVPKRVTVKQEPKTSGEDDEGCNSGEQMPRPLAYPPLPRSSIKEEISGEDHNVEGHQQLIAYAPIAKLIIKYESQFRDDHDGINLESKEEIMNPMNNEATDVVVNPSDRREAGDERGKASKRKRAAGNNIAVAAGLDDLGGSPPGVMTMTSTTRDSRTQSNRSRSLLSAGNFESSEKKSEAEELVPVVNMEVQAERTRAQENDEQLWNEILVAYPPIPKVFIKEEPRDEDNNSEESQIIAYPPIPRITMSIKEEVTDREEIAPEIHLAAYRPITLSTIAIKEELADHEEMAFGIHQAIQQQEGVGNLVNQSEAKDAPNVASFVDSQSAADHAGNGTKRLRTTKRKRISTASRPTQQTREEEMGSNSRTLRSRSKMILSPTMNDGIATEKRTETDKLPVEQSDRREEQQNANCNAAAGKISEHSSLKDKDTARNSSDSYVITASLQPSVEPVGDRSEAVPSRLKKKAADHHEPGVERGKTSKRKRSSAVNDASIAGISADSSSPDPEPERSYSKKGKKHTMKKRAGPIGSSDDKKLVESAGPSELKVKATKRSTSTANRRSEEKECARPFKCSNCERSYTVKKLLNRHVMHECNVEPKFRCKECDHHFAQKFNLKKHLLTIHKIDPSQLAAHGYEPKERPVNPYKCGKCERTYKLKRGLYSHQKFECGVGPAFPCTLCDFRTALKGNLRTHLVHVHQVAPSDLDHFQAAALVVRPENPFKCEQCGRSYKGKKALKWHLIHQCGMEKSFKCPHCDFRTHRKSNVTRHVKNVHGEGPASLPKYGNGTNVRYRHSVPVSRAAAA